MVKFKKIRTWWKKEVAEEKKYLLSTVVVIALLSFGFSTYVNIQAGIYKTRADEKDKEILMLVIVFKENLLSSENGKEEILERMNSANQKSSEYKSMAFNLEAKAGTWQITFQSSLFALMLILFDKSIKKPKRELKLIVNLSIMFSLSVACLTLIASFFIV